MEGMSFEEALADLVAEMGGVDRGLTETAATYAPGIAVQDGRPSLENDYSRRPQANPRPADVMQPVAETLAATNPLIAAQVGGQMAGSAYNSMREGEYLRGAGEAALAAASFTPGFKPSPRPMGGAAPGAARRATLREALAERPVNPITSEQLAAKENRLLALQSGRPASPKDIPMPARETVDPQYWSAPPVVKDAINKAPTIGAGVGGSAEILQGGDPLDVAGGAIAGGTLGLLAKYGGNAAVRRAEDAARARGPANAQQIIDADRSYSQGLDAAARQQEGVNRLLMLEEQARTRDALSKASSGPLALPKPPDGLNIPRGMNYQMSGWGDNRRSGFVDPMADPRTPIERPNPAAQRRYAADMAYRNSNEAKLISDAAKARDVEVFAKNLDNPETLTKNLKLFSDVTAQMGQRMSVEDIARAMEARGMFVNLPQYFMQPRGQPGNKGQFASMSPEAKRFRDAIWEARNAREKRINYEKSKKGGQ